MENKYCDLHVHSNCSDGSESPEKLIEIAKEAGLKAVALCDHNTVSGLKRFVAAAEGTGIIAVPGVEITSGYKGREVHILALFIRSDMYGRISEFLSIINTRKEQSNIETVKNLSDAGYEIDYKSVKELAGDAVPNRAYIAQALLAKGYVSEISEAFDTMISKNGEYYKPAEKLDALEVIRFLKSVSAVPVMAHPFIEFDREGLDEFLGEAKKCGLAAIETVYPLFSEEEHKSAVESAEKHGLLQSGGSDFHGIRKPDIKMGTGKNNITVPFEFYEKLASYRFLQD